jgi:hypothetical protein
MSHFLYVSSLSDSEAFFRIAEVYCMITFLTHFYEMIYVSIIYCTVWVWTDPEVNGQ